VIRPGEPWGSPTSSSPDVEVTGSDGALARAVAAAPGSLIRFVPDASSDVARAVGLRPGPTATVHTELPMDALSVNVSGRTTPGAAMRACNMCVFGTAPDRLRWWSPSVELHVEIDGRPWFSGRATTLVVAIGQFLRGLDVVPRGHPGDGKAEVQVYELRRNERRLMRARLTAGSHLPHPRIRSRTATRVEVRAGRPAALEADGEGHPAADHASLEVVSGAYRLLI
jgi:hypothetical protein